MTCYYEGIHLQTLNEKNTNYNQMTIVDFVKGEVVKIEIGRKEGRKGKERPLT